MDKIVLTISFFTGSDEYLDFEEVKPDYMEPGENRTIQQCLTLPEDTAKIVVDVSAVKQTWLKRHWQVISTVGIVLWGIIILVRRLG